MRAWLGRKLFLKLILLLILCGSVASAQVALEQANNLRFARFSEMIRIRSLALTIEPSEEIAGGMLEHDLPMFAGSLEGINPSLLEKLKKALEEIKELAEAGNAPAIQRLRPRVIRLLEQAQRTLIPVKVRTDPAFQAALIAQLLNLEEGVAEAYEEAANGEDEAYAMAWAGLQRVKVLYQPLKRRWSASAKEAIAKADEAFGRLSKLIASAEPPERFPDPEDAETAALDASYALEQAAGKTLLLQDLSAALSLVYARTDQACKASQKGDEELAEEWIAAANLYFAEHLDATLRTLAPELQAKIAPVLSEQLPQSMESKSPELSGQCGTLLSSLVQAKELLK